MGSQSGGEHIEVVEVSPRDGLQNEDRVLTPQVRAAFIHKLMDAGAKRIEAVSFVHPKLVPQMADAEEVMSLVERRDGVSLIGLVLNERGFERALDAGVDEANFAFAATDVFNQKNGGLTTDESLAIWERIAGRGWDAGLKMSVTIGVSFGCHFAGEVSADRVVELARRSAEVGADEIAIADTIGVGVPSQVHALASAIREILPDMPLRAHFHNTRNTGFANAAAAVDAGITTLDASVGGIGGCPFAPGAAGNIATEDLVYLVERMGYTTGLSLPNLIETAGWIEEQLGHPVTALLGKAGDFPGERATVDVPT